MGLKTISRLVISLAVVILITACDGSKVDQTTTLDTHPAWSLPKYKSSIAIVTLDFQTLQLKAAYVTSQISCDENHPPVSDEELKLRASGLFNAVGKSWSRYIIRVIAQ